MFPKGQLVLTKPTQIFILNSYDGNSVEFVWSHTMDRYVKTRTLPEINRERGRLAVCW